MQLVSRLQTVSKAVGFNINELLADGIVDTPNYMNAVHAIYAFGREQNPSFLQLHINRLYKSRLNIVCQMFYKMCDIDIPYRWYMYLSPLVTGHSTC